MTHDGEFWALSTPERLTKENGYGFWPTPVKTDGFAVGWCLTSIERKERGETRPSGAHIGSGLKYFRKTGQYLSNGYPNPALTEWLMGWPTSWTDLRPLEMDKFRLWLHSHGKSSTAQLTANAKLTDSRRP
jgi:DNA (cytosine-5)-methyltransferase 1